MVQGVFSVTQDPLRKRRRRQHMSLDYTRYDLFVRYERKFCNKTHKSAKNDEILLLESRKNNRGTVMNKWNDKCIDDK